MSSDIPTPPGHLLYSIGRKEPPDFSGRRKRVALPYFIRPTIYGGAAGEDRVSPRIQSTPERIISFSMPVAHFAETAVGLTGGMGPPRFHQPPPSAWKSAAVSA
jgi:hypothetical protein